jgi:CheY-like chemotaxis protein
MTMNNNNKILLVDDQSDIRLLVKMGLNASSKQNLDILEAENGVSGLAMIQQQQPCLVVLDVMMPGEMDGFDVLERVKNDPNLKSVRIIMLSACADQQSIEKATRLGADGYFKKPFSPIELASKIERMMNE